MLQRKRLCLLRDIVHLQCREARDIFDLLLVLQQCLSLLIDRLFVGVSKDAGLTHETCRLICCDFGTIVGAGGHGKDKFVGVVEQVFRDQILEEWSFRKLRLQTFNVLFFMSKEGKQVLETWLAQRSLDAKGSNTLAAHTLLSSKRSTGLQPLNHPDDNPCIKLIPKNEVFYMIKQK